MSELKKEYVYIIVAVILACAYIGGEWLKINHKEKIRQENIEYKQKQREACDDCIKQAEDNYHCSWEDNCKSKGLKKDCSLDLDIAKALEKTFENNRKSCIEQFKNNAFEVEE